MSRIQKRAEQAQAMMYSASGAVLSLVARFVASRPTEQRVTVHRRDIADPSEPRASAARSCNIGRSSSGPKGTAKNLPHVSSLFILTLTAAAAQIIVSSVNASSSSICQWVNLFASAGLFLLALAVAHTRRNISKRLSALSSSMLASLEGCGATVGETNEAKDDIDRMAGALAPFCEALRRGVVNEANLKAAVENMVEGIVMISADGKVALHNQRLLTIFGLPPMNAVGMSRADFNAMLVEAVGWPQSAQQYLQEQLAEVRKDGRYRVFDVELPNNRVLRYSASMLADGNVMSYIQDISEQCAAAASILRLAHYDTLTDLPNRALFQERLSDAIHRAISDPAASTNLLLCDLDRFKMVNDTYGHPIGDELLRQATQRMSAQIRSGDTLARLGGDEFALICADGGRFDSTEHLARRLIACLKQPFEIQGHEICIGISIGISNVPLHASSADELLKRADIALYAAKKDGRNTYRLYEPSMSMLIDTYSNLESALRRALDTGELHLHYQPQVDLRTRRIVGFEALCRWNHSDKGAVSPAIFIPVAEETGLVVPLGAWALRQACMDAAGWGDDIMIAVNVAPQQLRVNGFVEMVQDALTASGVRPARLELEITESAPLSDDETMLGVLEGLAGLGVRISMDDFGSGNTGLSYLHKFRFDKLKIDQSFVRRLGIWSDAELIVRAIVELSATLRLKTVAEGVETEHQATLLHDMGCAVGQGFLFGRPVPVGLVQELLAKQRSQRPERPSGRSPAALLSHACASSRMDDIRY